MPYTKCPCENCGQNIEVDSDHLGQKVICPHCGGSTVLGSRMVQAVYVPPAPPRMQPVPQIIIAPPSAPTQIVIQKKHGPIYYMVFILMLLGLLGIAGCVAVMILGMNYQSKYQKEQSSTIQTNH